MAGSGVACLGTGSNASSATALIASGPVAIGVTRRRLLAAGLGVAAARGASAQVSPKMSQAAAQYQDNPRGGLICIGCTFFRRPRSCEVVEGDISPQGWCKLFDLPD
jgi:hypothetical protein